MHFVFLFSCGTTGAPTDMGVQGMFSTYEVVTYLPLHQCPSHEADIVFLLSNTYLKYSLIILDFWIRFHQTFKNLITNNF
jgi:hypothetical protein